MTHADDDGIRRPGWDWLANTYWYCPAADVPALLYGADGSLAWIDDQTIWHVTGSKAGYFWGRGVVLLATPGQPDSRRRAPMTFIGSITPANQVHITFRSGAGAPTVAIGSIDGKPKKAQFSMQMSSGAPAGLVVHWAHMLQVREGDPEWTDLPCVGASVDAVLAGVAAPPDPPAVG
jgi:hypothetical protein